MLRSRSLSDNVLLRVAEAFLVLLAAWLLVLGLSNVAHRSDWAMGDWLINYSGGFVRRGLVGALVRLLVPLHVPSLWAVLLLQWSLYAVVLGAVWSTVRPLRWSVWLAALFFSPATLAFALQEPSFAFRKEILYFALLAGVLQRFVRSSARKAVGPAPSNAGFSALLCAGCAVCVLSHEALIVFLPYLLAALLLGFEDRGRALRCFSAPAVVSLALFACVSRFPGDAAVSQAVCRSLGGELSPPSNGLCGGAIDYLARSPQQAHAEVRRVARSEHYVARMPWLVGLALAPALVGVGSLWRAWPFAARVLLGAMASAWPLSTFLFFYGTDWTRWIFIHTFSLFLLLLFAERVRQCNRPAAVCLAGSAGRAVWAAAIVVTLFYCFGWELTPYRQPRWPYSGLMHFVQHDLLTHRPAS